LKQHGVWGSLLNWISNYSSNREQRLIVGHVLNMLKQVCLLALFLVLFCSLYYTKSIKHNSFICRWYLFSFYDLNYWRPSGYY